MELGTVERIEDGGAIVRLDAETEARQKPMKIPAGSGVASGDCVIVQQIGGTYMIINRYVR